ncbi:MAG: ArsR/SmtB family transcription factor [Thermodesulfovibrionales bacterium]
MNYTDFIKDNDKLERLSRILRGISHPVRLKIGGALCIKEYTVGELVDLTNITQSAVSQHLSLMKLLRLIGSRREGSNNVYFIVEKNLRNLLYHKM